MEFESEEKALRRRAVLKGALTRLENYLKKNTEFSKNELICRQQNLDKTFSDLDCVYNYLENQADTKTFEEYLTGRADFENKYYCLHAKLQDLIDSFTTTVSPDGSVHSSKSGRSSTNLKLPALNIPTFDGDFAKFRTYKNTFESLVINNVQLDNVQRLHYLISSLQGEPKELLANIPIAEENLDLCWRLILERYDNKRIIIAQHVKQLLDLHQASSGSCSDYRKLLNQVKSNLNAIETLNIEVPLHDLLLSHIILTKIKFVHKGEWENNQTGEIPCLSQLLDFLEKKCQTMELTETNKQTVDLKKPGFKVKSKLKSLCASTVFDTKHCSYCGKTNHMITDCHKFLNQTVDQRRNFVNVNRLCFKCFSSKHGRRFCKQSTCSVCNGNHHELVHKAVGPLQTETEGATVSTHTSMKVVNGIGTNVLLSTARVSLQGPDGRTLTVKALLDSGSQLSFLTSKLAKKLKLQTKSCNIPVTGISNLNVAPVSTTCKVKIASFTSDFNCELNCAVVPVITSQLPAQRIDISTWNIPEDVVLADPTFNESSEIQLLIGAEVYHKLILNEVRTKKEHPTLLNTVLGWVLAGAFPLSCISKGNPPRRVNFVKLNALETTLQKFWEIEEINSPVLTPEEQACENYFLETTYRDENGKFVVRLPRRTDVPPVAESRPTALKRLRQIERKLEGNAQLKTEYHHFMKEYKDLVHMEVAAETENLKYFLPHHCVVKEDSLTTKLRVVFDASCESSNGISLNSMLMVGPTVQPDLLSTVIKFRSYCVALSADIAKMYRCVLVHEDDRDLQRIVWRESPQAPVTEYRLTTVTYGTAPASFLACRCLNRLAEDCKTNFPAASEAINNCFYVDDLLSGAASVQEAQLLQRQLTEILDSAGFHLRKWASNETEALINVPEEDKQHSSPCNLTKDETVKTLGIIWHPTVDKFQFQIKLKPLPAVLTKRNILAIIASIYDPLGLLGPAIIKCKLFMQSLWQLKLSWDESLMESTLTEEWSKLHCQLPLLNQIYVDRKILPFSSDTPIELHGFCDSSEVAYAACVYVRSISNNNEVSTALIASKSRVAPLKKKTIARLELCGAVLLSRLMKKVIEALKLSETAKTFFWTDSTIVLCWLQRPSHTWKTFVANRVAEVQETSNIADWKHVAGTENPADFLSRGVEPAKLSLLREWWHGPSFLSEINPVYTDFVASEHHEAAAESKPVITGFSRLADVSIFERFSRWTKLIRVYAYVLRFINNLKLKRLKNSAVLQGPLKTTEMNLAVQKIVKSLQAVEYRLEIQRLKKDQMIPPASKLKSLSPFLDQDNVLRVGGRLENSGLAFEEKHPVIFPPNTHVTKLLISHEHESLLHAGPQAVLFSLRNKYWIPTGKNVVRHVIRKCYRCFRMKPPATTYLMGQLPESRVRPSPAFSNTGVDYAGPLLIKGDNPRSKTKLKSYLAIFVCMATKAIHLELVRSLTTADFLAALRRFIARRGKPVSLYSDNGTNFVGANNELQSFLKENSSLISDFASLQSISWNFIPPSSPHFGGLWEAGVKSVKSHLYKSIGNSILSYEELFTFLCQVEAVLNSRPISSLSDGFDNFFVLSPGHFLIGRPLTSVPEPDLCAVPCNRLSRWQLVQQMFQSFWKRWSKDYLHTLQQRRKWSTAGAWNPAVGDVVLIREDNLPPLTWRTGVITALHPGADGIIRVARVKTVAGMFKRALVKLCPLPE